MFRRLLNELVEEPAAALDEQLRQLELECRALDARRLALRAAAELKQVPAVDGHTSTQAYLRATCNQPSWVASTEVRRARVCRDFPAIGDALMHGQIGLGQVDQFVRIYTNERAAGHLDEAQVEMLLGHAAQFRIRDFVIIVDRWLAWADADGAALDERANVEARSATVVADADGLVVQMNGGSKLAAEAFKNIHAHFTKLEFQHDVEARRAEHGVRADRFPLGRTSAQRKYDALLAMARAGMPRTVPARVSGPSRSSTCSPISAPSSSSSPAPASSSPMASGWTSTRSPGGRSPPSSPSSPPTPRPSSAAAARLRQASRSTRASCCSCCSPPTCVGSYSTRSRR